MVADEIGQENKIILSKIGRGNELMGGMMDGKNYSPGWVGECKSRFKDS